MIHPGLEWKSHAARLADDLIAAGKLTDPRLADAVRETPRHVFVPAYHRQTADGGWAEHRSTDDLAAVYANTALITALTPERAVLSSSTQPGLMTRMIESLQLADGMRVLEIGTGTGYNAALLTHLLGERNVFSIDIEPGLVELARTRIPGRPTLVTGDGAQGLPEHAPFDAIIATCAVPAIPWPWIDQVRPGGVILADLKPAPGAGSLVRLTRQGDGAEGRFDPTYAAFMDLRPAPGTAGFRVERGHAEYRTTDVDPNTPWTSLVTWFIASFDLGSEIAYGYTFPEGSAASSIATPDGSWAEITLAAENGRHAVAEGGPRRLWRLVEEAHRLWTDLGCPGWDRFGFTATPQAQTVSLDGGHSWRVTGGPE
ncbi:methyltransferase domain-containing protein [Amycolatopsis jejuensis]|uniref:methyltransferase domain-containing protein n=1 Tax=Amycolatopsis jejuensis TaxID=330084 RepID=UPI0005254DC2|nr:methyltransferase domain-containing protein [Amycolatopsis jejuensis]